MNFNLFFASFLPIKSCLKFSSNNVQHGAKCVLWYVDND